MDSPKFTGHSTPYGPLHAFKSSRLHQVLSWDWWQPSSLPRACGRLWKLPQLPNHARLDGGQRRIENAMMSAPSVHFLVIRVNSHFRRRRATPHWRICPATEDAADFVFYFSMHKSALRLQHSCSVVYTTPHGVFRRDAAKRTEDAVLIKPVIISAAWVSTSYAMWMHL